MWGLTCSALSLWPGWLISGGEGPVDLAQTLLSVYLSQKTGPSPNPLQKLHRTRAHLPIFCVLTPATRQNSTDCHTVLMKWGRTWKRGEFSATQVL